MTLNIQQGFTYQGNDWLEGADNELDEVDHVVYILHSTFPNPVRTIKDRKTKFKLETGGWGVFMIKVDVVKKNGEKLRLTHSLVLEYPEPQTRSGD